MSKFSKIFMEVVIFFVILISANSLFLLNSDYDELNIFKIHQFYKNYKDCLPENQEQELKELITIEDKVQRYLTTNSIIICVLLIGILLYNNYKDYKNNQQENIQNTKNMFEKIDNTRNIITENLAHELGTPISILNKLFQKYNKSFTPKDLKIFNDTFKYFYIIMAKISKYKKIKENNNTLYDIIDFSLNAIIITLAKLEYQIDDRLKDYKVNISNTELSGILINCIKNSIEAHATEVNFNLVYFNSDTDRICFEIQDDGNGIPNEILRNIFKESNSSKGSNRGNGLYINKVILEENNGKINVKNNEVGCSVKIILNATKVLTHDDYHIYST